MLAKVKRRVDALERRAPPADGEPRTADDMPSYVAALIAAGDPDGELARAREAARRWERETFGFELKEDHDER